MAQSVQPKRSHIVLTCGRSRAKYKSAGFFNKNKCEQDFSVGFCPLGASVRRFDGIACIFLYSSIHIYSYLYRRISFICSKKEERNVFSKNMRQKAKVIMHLLVCSVRSRSCAHFYKYFRFFPLAFVDRV